MQRRLIAPISGQKILLEIVNDLFTHVHKVSLEVSFWFQNASKKK